MSSVSFCCSSFFPEQSKKRLARPEECPELPRPTLVNVTTQHTSVITRNLYHKGDWLVRMVLTTLADVITVQRLQPIKVN